MASWGAPCLLWEAADVAAFPVCSIQSCASNLLDSAISSPLSPSVLWGPLGQGWG